MSLWRCFLWTLHKIKKKTNFILTPLRNHLGSNERWQHSFFLLGNKKNFLKIINKQYSDLKLWLVVHGVQSKQLMWSPLLRVHLSLAATFWVPLTKIQCEQACIKGSSVLSSQFLCFPLVIPQDRFNCIWWSIPDTLVNSAYKILWSVSKKRTKHTITFLWRNRKKYHKFIIGDFIPSCVLQRQLSWSWLVT